MESFKGFPQEAELPSAPKQFIRYMTEDNRPQVSEDVNYEHGMGVSVGRLREDTVYDYKFVGIEDIEDLKEDFKRVIEGDDENGKS